MKNKINLNKEISIDIPKLIEGGMVILANSGGGKSYAIRKIAEEANEKVQTIIIDPEGEFASLREKYDFILAGKGADVPVEVRSAALLAIRLLELGKSAVIDLYELHPSERQRYVKLFCEAMVNCKKELYHPVLVILDEAHEYVPEGKPSEATWAVESLASKGRKRGQRLILASQRISKLSKNASAECNNKLIGRASQDIDMKRAGDELGFNKEKLKELRQLKPGEFFAFGPAISDDVVKVKVGEVKTAHAKVGYKNANKVPPPSHVIKKILGELADLPAEVEKEAKTIAEFKAEIKQLKTKITQIPKQEIPITSIKIQNAAVQRAVKERDKEWQKIVVDIKKQFDDNVRFTNVLVKDLEEIQKITSRTQRIKQEKPTIRTIPMRYSDTKDRPIKRELFIASPGLKIPSQKEINREFSSEEKPLSKGAKAILSYLYSVYPYEKSKTQMWVATGYSPGGGFNNLIYELTGKGLIEQTGKGYKAHNNYDMSMVDDFHASLDLWKNKLGTGPRKIFDLMLKAPESVWMKDQLAQDTGYAIGGGFNNNI